jgi:hypothetical protein
LHAAGKLADAEKAYRSLIAVGESSAEARNNLLALLRDQARWRDAEILIRDALAEDPTSSVWETRLFSELVRAGRWDEAWPHYESRRRSARDRVAAPSLSFPEWTGQPVRSLLVWPEQGLGDMIQFARFTARLQQAGIAVSIVCGRPLARLFAPLGANIILAEGSVSIPTHDAWVLMGSLPWRLGATVTDVPPPIPVTARPRVLGARIGVAAQGKPNHFNDAHRSLPPALEDELLALPAAISLAPAKTGARDLQDTAEVIAGLDLVVSVDTAVAHLAGSMGKSTWVLLPHLNTDWRWMRDRSDSPWYPSVRLFRQPQPGDWQSVIGRVREALSERVAPR